MIRVQGYVQDYDVVRLPGDLSSLWYVARLTTYLDLKSLLRFEDPVRLQVKSYISNKQF
jgi:hypothetical protein